MKHLSIVKPSKIGCVLLASLALPLSGARAAKAPPSLRAYSVANSGRQACGMYLNNQKAGWMIFEARLETRGAGAAKREVLVARSEMHVQMNRGVDQMNSDSTTASYYALTGDGALLYSEENSHDGATTGKQTARPKPNNPKQLLIVTQRNGQEVGRRTTTTHDTLRVQQQFQSWLTSTPRRGSKFQMPSLDLSKGGDIAIDFTFQTAKTIRWGGVATRVFSVNMKMQGMNASADIQSNGWPLRARLGGVFDLRAEDEALAKKPGGPVVDMLAASELTTNRRVANPRGIKRLSVELSDIGDFAVPASARQKVVSQQGNKAVLLLQREPSTAATRLSVTERAVYMQGTPQYSQTPAIKKLARTIVRNERDPVKKAALLQHWVYRNLRQTMAAEADTAAEVLKTRAGDCTEHTLLFIALARASGLPARDVSGLMYADTPQGPIFAWHAWAQIHDGKGWVSIDPTWDQVRVDATHIEFAHGEDDWGWVNVLGTLHIKILDSK